MTDEPIKCDKCGDLYYPIYMMDGRCEDCAEEHGEVFEGWYDW